MVFSSGIVHRNNSGSLHTSVILEGGLLQRVPELQVGSGSEVNAHIQHDNFLKTWVKGESKIYFINFV